MQKASTLLYFLFSVFILSAQTKKESYNSLLWRISGNGLSKPSWVYGTFHITDKRVFHFTDSLYKSLEQCEGFAAELDINSFFSEYFNTLMDEEENKPGSQKLLVDSLDKKTIAKYKTVLEMKFKKPIAEITIGELNDVADEWMTEMLKKGEMNTFMDAWLFDVARRQGKWVGGIEDYEDQQGLKDSISIIEKIETFTGKPGDKGSLLEWMIRIYLHEDLDSIDRTDNVWRGSRDALLVRRNIKMARRMDSLARIRSTLFAVGAAHIPSDEGVVHLLRQKGFTVTPVYSKNRISPDDYTYKRIELPWYNVVVPDSSYQLKMPGLPITRKIDEEEGSPDMSIYVDLGNFRAYIHSAFPVPTPGGDRFEESVMENLVKYYRETMTAFTEKDIVVNGYKGKEIVGVDKEDAEIRVQLFTQGSFLVMNGICGYKRSVLFGDEPEKFLNSFIIKNKTNTRTSLAEKKKWERYDLDKFGFSVELPVKYKEQKMDREDPSWDQKYFYAIDATSITYMGMMISTVKKGYYSSSDSAFFEESVQNLVTNLEAELMSKEFFLKHGYPAFTASGISEKAKDPIAIKIFMINKGPRRYLLFTTADEKNDGSETTRFFNSFEFLKEPTANWSRQPSPDKSFSAWAPANILLENDLERGPNEIKYMIHDTTTGVQVFIDKEIFPAYYWAKNDSTLLADKVNTFTSYSDSVIFRSEFKKGRIRVADLFVQLAGTHNRKRLKALLNGDTLYTIYSFLPSESLETINYKKLFSDFEISNEVVSASLYKRKPKELLLALQTKDSTAFAGAKEAFDYVEFIPEDVPLLQQALLHRYYDFDTNYYYSINNSISSLIRSLDSTHSTIRFIRDNYSRLNGDNEIIKPYLLGLLSEIKTKTSYELFRDLIVKSTPKISNEYYFQNGLYDSLNLTRSLYPDILSVVDDPGLYDLIGELSLTMLDSGLIDVAMLRTYKDALTRSAKKALSLRQDVLKEEYYRYTNLVKLLGKMNTPETNNLIRQFGMIDANSLKLDVVIALARNNLQPDAKDLAALAKDDEFRLSLYEQLKDLKKQTLFPKTFLTQRWLAQSTMYEYANEDEYPPDSIQLIGERIESYLGKKQKFYLFKLCFIGEEEDEDAECYFGAVGPYSLDPKNLETNDDLTEVYWDESFDSKKINEWFKDMITRTEKWVKERDTKK